MRGTGSAISGVMAADVVVLPLVVDVDFLRPGVCAGHPVHAARDPQAETVRRCPCRPSPEGRRLQR